MAATGQSCSQRVHPVQSVSSISALLSLSESAGQPISRMQRLQPMQRARSTVLLACGFASTTHGLLKMMAFTPGSSTTRRTHATAAAWSSGSTVSTTVSPMPRSTFSIETFSTAWPIMVRPVPGCG